MEALALKGVEVKPHKFLSGLDLLARVADEARDEPLRSRGGGVSRKVKVKKVKKIKKNHGGLGEETRKRLEFALAKLKGCKDKLELVQSRLASVDGGELFSVEWNETEGHYQIGQATKTDRIYAIYIWISAARNFSTDAPIRNELNDDEELQVNLMSNREKVLSSRSIPISDLKNTTAELRVALKGSALQFYNFLENSYIKMKPSRSSWEEKQVHFIELPDRIATSCGLEFSATNQTDMPQLEPELKLNVLTYLESSLLEKKQGSSLDEVLQRKFEFTFGDPNLLSLCWSMKKKLERTRVIELSPKVSECDVHLVPLDLTHKSSTIQNESLSSNTDANEKNRQSSDPELSSVVAPSPSTQMSGSVHHSDMEADQGSSVSLSLNLGPQLATKDIEIQQHCEKDGLQTSPLSSPPPALTWTTASTATSTFTSSVSATSLAASSIRRKRLGFKWHKPKSEPWLAIKAFEKKLAAAIGSAKAETLQITRPFHQISPPAGLPSAPISTSGFPKTPKLTAEIKTYGKNHRNRTFGQQVNRVES